MLESLTVAPPDSILGLMEAFNNDPRHDKVNLTVGVFKDEQGNTPILTSVKKAEQKLLREEISKTYLAIEGLPTFNRLITELVTRQAIDPKRVATLETPGGTGALRVMAEMLAANYPNLRIWLSQPTWPNHPSIFQRAGLQVQSFPYLDPTKTRLDLPAMLETLKEQGQEGDLVCLHACCHNPTGIDPQEEDWRQISELLRKKKMIPFLDFAYLGFGKGLVEDTLALRILLEQHDEICVAVSFSKNFGLYSERVGAAMITCRDEATTQSLMSQLRFTVRTIYSNPPRHGGAIVATILGDPDLHVEWEAEVLAMRSRIDAMRTGFVEGLKRTGTDRDFGFLANQLGMFSYTGLNALQADWLKQHKGIYLVGSGRINVAGLTVRNLPFVTESIVECIESTRSVDLAR